MRRAKAKQMQKPVLVQSNEDENTQEKTTDDNYFETCRIVTELTSQTLSLTSNHITTVAKAIYSKQYRTDQGFDLNFMSMYYGQQAGDGPQNDKQMKPQQLSLKSFILRYMDEKENLQPAFAIVTVDLSNWFLLGFFKILTNTLLLYFDPNEMEIPVELSTLTTECVPSHIYKVHKKSSNPPFVESKDTSLICLRYYESILMNIRKLQIESEFDDVVTARRAPLSPDMLELHLINFIAISQKNIMINLNLSPENRKKEAKSLRKRFQTMCHEKLGLRAESTYTDFFKKFLNLSEVVEDVNKYLDETLAYEGVNGLVDDYRKELERLAKGARNVDENIARKKLFDNMQVKALMDLAKKKQNSNSNVEATDYELKRNSKHEAAVKALTALFGYLSTCKEGDKALQPICRRVGLDFEKVKKVFQLREQQGESAEDEEMGNNKAFFEGIQYDEALPKTKSPSLLPEPEMKTLDDVLQEMENDDKSGDFQPVTQEECKNGYNNVIQSYDKKWSTKGQRDILEWALNMRKVKLNKQDIPDAIAAMDRGNELITKGHRLRIPQIISLLIMSTSNGQVCQVHTGEGKTTIVSMLAILKILLGEPSIDVVTSNTVLADEAVKEKKKFYCLFGITVATNNPIDRQNDDEGTLPGGGIEPRKCYRTDVVYGNIGSFQFDYLRDISDGTGIRGQRGFCTLILDEVDSMLIDSGGHIAKLSMPFPGMESLRYIYIQIWMNLQTVEQDLIKEVAEKLKAKEKELKAKEEELKAEEEELKAEEKELKAEEEELKVEEEELECKNRINAASEYNDLSQRLMLEIYGNIKKKIKENVLVGQIDLIPDHLKIFAEASMDKWIDNAINAKFMFKENEDYYLKPSPESGELVVIPIDYRNTGSTLKNTVWSHALHQFVQLKHNIQLTSESLTSCCISNFGYINLYGSRIYGLTGTLGSEPEQRLIQKMYKVKFARIPPFKVKRFQEIKGNVVPDLDWAMTIAVDTANRAVKQGRAVLIICKTIADCYIIEKCLKIVNENPQNYNDSDDLLDSPTQLSNFLAIRKFIDENDANVTSDILRPGDVVVATNIAGRGADFKTSSELEVNGGLHVCLGFYPDNERVKDQAMYRTARQGKFGTAQIIVRLSEVQQIHSTHNNRKAEVEAARNRNGAIHDLESDQGSSDDSDYFTEEEPIEISKCEDERPSNLRNFEVTRKLVYENETMRIEQLKLYRVNELYFQDKLFQNFSNFSRRLSSKYRYDPCFRFILQDLREYWAFWIDENDLDGLVTTVQVDKNFEDENDYWTKTTQELDALAFKEFNKFQQVVINLTGGETKTPQICRNPYYSINQAELFLGQNKTKEAEKAINRAIQISGSSNQILYSCYMKKFEVILEKAGVLKQKFYDTLGKVLIFGHFVDVKNSEYKEEAKKALDTAKSYLEKEVDYIEQMQQDQKFVRILESHKHIFSEQSTLTRDEMLTIGKGILAPLNVDVEKRFQVYSELEDFMANSLDFDVTYYACVNISRTADQPHWVAVCYTNSSSSEMPATFLLVDPYHNDDSPTLEHTIRRHYSNVKIDLRQYDEGRDGGTDIMSLSNLERMAKDECKMDFSAVVQNFPTMQFCQGKLSVAENSSDGNDEASKSLPSERQRFFAHLNILFKYINSRLNALRFYMHHIGELKNSIDANRDGVMISSRIPGYLKNLKPKEPTERELKSALQEATLSELESIGMNVLYSVRQVHDVSSELITSAQVHIATGLAAFTTATFFPPSLPFVAPIAGTLISEGIMDIVFALLDYQGAVSYNRKAYIKGKIISYAIGLATAGLGAIFKSAAILEKAANACKGLADILRNCKYFRTVCNMMAKLLEKLGNYLQKLAMLAKEASDMQQMARQIDRLEKLRAQQFTFTSLMWNTVKDCTKNAVGSMVMEKVTTHILETNMQELKPTIRKHVERAVASALKPDLAKLRYVESTDFKKACDEVLNGTLGDMCLDICREVSLGVARHCGNWQVKLGAFAVDTCTSFLKIYQLSETFCGKVMEKKLDTKRDQVSKPDDLKDYAIDLVTGQAYSLIMQYTGKYTNMFIVSPIVSKVAGAIFMEDESKQNPTPEELEELREKLIKEYGFSNEDSAEKMQLSCLKDVVRVKKDLENLKNVKEGKMIGTHADFESLSNQTGRPIIVRDHKTGRVLKKVGEGLEGDPIELEYDKSRKHYTLPGGVEPKLEGGLNDCLLNSIAEQTNENPEKLRNGIVQSLKDSLKNNFHKIRDTQFYYSAILGGYRKDLSDDGLPWSDIGNSDETQYSAAYINSNEDKLLAKYRNGKYTLGHSRRHSDLQKSIIYVEKENGNTSLFESYKQQDQALRRIIKTPGTKNDLRDKKHPIGKRVSYDVKASDLKMQIKIRELQPNGTITERPAVRVKAVFQKIKQGTESSSWGLVTLYPQGY